MSNFKNILVIIGVLGIFVLHPSLNKDNSPISYLQYLVYGNSLNVSCNNSVDISSIQIKWVCDTQSAVCNDLVIFEKGKQINKIPFEKGKQQLIAFYNGNKIGAISQNKTTSKQAHQYKIDLTITKKIIFFNGEIIGPAPAINSVRNTSLMASRY
jgi:hypothetical protein